MNSLSKKQIAIVIIIGFMFFIIIGGYLYNIYSKDNEDILDNELMQIDEDYQQISEESGKVVVHIAGEVNSPGIVEVSSGSRIADILEQAEGVTENADMSKVNLAYIVQDGQKIIIPQIQENDETVGENTEYIVQENGKDIIEEQTAKEATVGIVNINKATQTELEQLPGIGPSTAFKIMEYRKTNKFKRIEDIKNVSGIGDAKFEKIKEHITI